MNVTQETSADTRLIRLQGELDASSSVSFDRDVLSQPELTQFRRVLIDCARLDYISSAGIGVFVSNLQRFQDAGTALVFFGMQDKVHNVFEILGLDALMTIVATEDDARAVPPPAHA